MLESIVEIAGPHKFFVIIKDKSERVPDKNFVLLGNKPLWMHLLDKLQDEQVFVDTDSTRILRSCRYAYQRLPEHINLEKDMMLDFSASLLESNSRNGVSNCQNRSAFMNSAV